MRRDGLSAYTNTFTCGSDDCRSADCMTSIKSCFVGGQDNGMFDLFRQNYLSCVTELKCVSSRLRKHLKMIKRQTRTHMHTHTHTHTTHSRTHSRTPHRTHTSHTHIAHTVAHTQRTHTTYTHSRTHTVAHTQRTHSRTHAQKNTCTNGKTKIPKR